MCIDPAVLRDIPLFTRLESPLLDQVAAISELRRYRADQTLFKAGAVPECLYVLRSGQVALESHGPLGDFVAVEVLRPPAHFNLQSVLLEMESLVAATAVDDSDLVCVDSTALRDLARRESAIAFGMLNSLSRRYQDLVRHVVDLKSRSVAKRLGCFLLSMAHEQGSDRLALPFEKRLLASRLGTTPESLSRAFAVLRTCGVATLGRNVTLGDPQTPGAVRETRPILNLGAARRAPRDGSRRRAARQSAHFDPAPPLVAPEAVEGAGWVGLDELPDPDPPLVPDWPGPLLPVTTSATSSGLTVMITCDPSGACARTR
jgi:CRP/FNR family transcriptional activator FtrB